MPLVEAVPVPSAERPAVTPLPEGSSAPAAIVRLTAPPRLIATTAISFGPALYA